MSFSSDVKHELCTIDIDESMKCAQLAALFLIRAQIDPQSHALVYKSGHAFIAKHVYMLLKELFGIQPKIAVVKRMNLKKNNSYRLSIDPRDFYKLEKLHILNRGELRTTAPWQLIRSEKNAKAFLQGAFLASGSINSPKSTNYHMELSCFDEELANSLIKIMERFHLNIRMVKRKSMWVLYLKASDKIADFLSLINASSSLFQYEDIRIQRDFYNQFTRLDNCEVANEIKTIKAAREQLAWIEQIEQNYHQKIDEKILHVMEARKENPEASILELCNAVYLKHGEIISKSGMKHRLSKIKSLASLCSGN